MKSKKVILGQFYTSKDVADFMVNLSTKKEDSKVLESGFGEGIFLQSLLNKGFSDIKGYDIDKSNCNFVKEKLGESVQVECLDYLLSPVSEKFDLVIGNPPYVQWNNISEDIRAKLSSDPFWREYVNGEWDLLYAFIIHSIEKLNEDGELIYIVPYNWFNSTYGASLRKYLISNGQFETICHFGEFKLFGDCYPNNIIFKYKKKKDCNDCQILVSEFKGRKGNVREILEFIKRGFKKVDQDGGEIEDKEFKIFKMPHFKDEHMWHLANGSETKYIDRVEKFTGGELLKDSLDIGVGIVSGYDNAYIMEELELGQFSDEEKDYIFPFIKAKNCKRYFVEGSSYYLFLDSILDEEEFTKYPNIYKRLKEHEEKLNKRYMSGSKNWWNWATVRNKALFERSLDQPKIFVPCIDRSLKSRYSYTNKRFFGAGDVLIIIPKEGTREDLRYVLAWLNSNIINDWYRVKGSHTGHRIRYTQSYVSKIPFKKINWNNEREVEVYNKVLEKVDALISGQENLQVEKEIDELFGSLMREF